MDHKHAFHSMKTSEKENTLSIEIFILNMMYFGHVHTSFPHLQLLLYFLLPFFSFQYYVHFYVYQDLSKCRVIYWVWYIPRGRNLKKTNSPCLRSHKLSKDFQLDEGFHYFLPHPFWYFLWLDVLRSFACSHSIYEFKCTHVCSVWKTSFTFIHSYYYIFPPYLL